MAKDSTSPLVPLVAMAQLALAALALLSGMMAAEMSTAMSIVGMAWSLVAAAAALGLLRRQPLAWTVSLLQLGLMLAVLLAFVARALVEGATGGLGWILLLYAAPTVLVMTGLWHTRPRVSL